MTNATSAGGVSSCGTDGDGKASGNNGTLNTFCTNAPRRMFLCEVPPCIKQQSTSNGDDDTDLFRLMGTVVEIIPSSSSTSPAENNSAHDMNMMHATPNNANNTTQMIYFVIDDGTGSIGVYAKRRVGANNGCDARSGNNTLPPTTMQNQFRDPHAKQMQQFQPANQHAAGSAVSLESILSSPHPPILVGQTVDCIGKIQIDTDGMKNDKQLDAPPSNAMLWLAASSVSIVNNHQAATLRQLELSSSNRLKMNTNTSNNQWNRNQRMNNNNAQNRIMVGGDLERKLNPLFHDTKEGSVSFNMEAAFNYIKYSKDDGGITPKEIATLVGAIEPNEVLAVNLAVERLREDCRVYINHGKWFPM